MECHFSYQWRPGKEDMDSLQQYGICLPESVHSPNWRNWRQKVNFVKTCDPAAPTGGEYKVYVCGYDTGWVSEAAFRRWERKDYRTGREKAAELFAVLILK